MSNLAKPDLANPNLADPDLADPSLAGGFVPTDIENLVLWGDLHSDYVTLNGNDVSAITDRSGNGNHIQQSDPAAQPLYVSSDADYGGTPSMSFDGASEWMQADSIASLFAGQDMPFTLFAAADFAGGSREVLASLTSTGSLPLHELNREADGAYRSLRYDDSGTLVNVLSDNAQPTAAAVQSIVFTGTAVSGYVNGTVVAGMDGAAQDVGTFTPTRFTIGVLRRNSLSDFLGGKIAELLVYSRALTASERSDVETYLLGKHSL